MRTPLPALALIALGGFYHQAGAQAQCPELTRLRSEATEAQRPPRRGLPLGGCESYIRSSLAWRAVLDYADEHREACGISDDLLNELERYHRQAVSARNNVCAGRPARPYPPEIIQR